MNLSYFSDSELLSRTESAVREEKKAITRVLHHLKEIERRRLFSAHKYSSLYEMAIKHYGYSEDEAAIRISAMRLMKELPEIEAKLESGDLNLTQVVLARSHFNNEDKLNEVKLTRDEKIDVLKKMENTSTRDTRNFLYSLSSSPVKLPADKIKPVSHEKVQVSFVADKEIEKSIGHLKGLLAHSNPGISLGELFQKLCELGIQEWSPHPDPKGKKLENKKSPASKLSIPHIYYMRNQDLLILF